MAVPQQELTPGVRPWPALWALVLGFFMILVDSTIVSVATPAIMTDLNADVGFAITAMAFPLMLYAQSMRARVSTTPPVRLVRCSAAQASPY